MQTKVWPEGPPLSAIEARSVRLPQIGADLTQQHRTLMNLARHSADAGVLSGLVMGIRPMLTADPTPWIQAWEVIRAALLNPNLPMGDLRASHVWLLCLFPEITWKNPSWPLWCLADPELGWIYESLRKNGTYVYGTPSGLNVTSNAHYTIGIAAQALHVVTGSYLWPTCPECRR